MMPPLSDPYGPEAEPLERNGLPSTGACASVEYHLDAKDRITGVNEEWDRFANRNGGDHLQSEALIGRSLHDFISGDVTKMFVNALLQSTRVTGKERTINYRCDSPDVKRYMAMDILPSGQGRLVSRHRTIQEVKMSTAITLVTATRASGVFIKRCSMCNRLSRNGESEVEPDAAAAAGWFGEGATQVIYFVCKDCQNVVQRFRGRPIQP